jgi:alpha-L-arabinofuranosidase
MLSPELDATMVRQTVLAHETLNAHNTFDKPDEVEPKSSDTKLQGASFNCVLPPASVTRLDIRLS